MSKKYTEIRPRTPPPWTSWGATVRYVVMRVAQAVPTGALIWLTYLHR
jgi:hypothetical protein